MKIGLISDIHANRPALAAVLADRPPVDDVPEELDNGEWEDELEEAREKADLPEPKGTLTTKTIENRDITTCSGGKETISGASTSPP